MLINYHTHTHYSADAAQSVRDNCKRAAELGFSEICITNHQEWPELAKGNTEYCLTEKKFESLISDLGKCRKEFSGLTIKLGVELGYMEGREKDMGGFLKKYPFDYVLGGVHSIDGQFISFYNGSNESLLREYFRLKKKLISSGLCDCIAHFDIFKRYFQILPAEEDIDECISLMKRHNVGFELNTMGWKFKNRQCYPSPDILKMFYDGGIRKVTIGSDCHNVDDFDFGISRGLRLLRDTGYREICTFSKRRAVYNPL